MNKGTFVAVLVFLSLLSLGFVSAYERGTIDFKISTNQTPCYVTIAYPNSTNLVFNQTMESQILAGYANLTFVSNFVGDYEYFGECGGIPQTGTFSITETGESLDSSQSLGVLALVGVMFLLFGFGRSFSQDKWKLKMFFDILAIGLAVITINSTRIILSQSGNLSSMASIGLYTMIVVLSVMIAYFLVIFTIELINKFRKKEEMRWQTSDAPY